MKKIWTLIFVCILAILCFPVQQVDAAESNNFSVKAVLPDNQASSVTYFDLQMEPKQKQKLDVEITNQSKEKMTINCVANTAITNEMGYVDYSIPKTKPDETLKYPFAYITEESDSEVSLEPNETKIWSVTVQMPEESYDGIILGGLHFKEKTKEKTEKETKQEKEVQIKNEYAYVIGVKLTEKTTVVKPELVLNQIKAGSRNYRNVVEINLQNTKATLVGGLAVDAKIYKKGSEKVLHESKRTDLSMAPNSNFNYSVDWKNQELKPGKYKLHLVAKNKDDKWEWTRDFTISSDEAKKANKKALGLEKDYTWMYIVGGLLLFILIIIATYFVGKRAAKKKDDEK
ncbi:DUF916 and DUF3324 domain-containing protein [Listeria farberi]|uniref:DUF916 and DUF3324 domain-containing protein n=1 Tax=Listeria farberi TaxID=2713500 RepID=A0A7X0ZJH0_9LIST|nr:DUF916 and DUF3324 domain-containing protein [Listeria farberi]MBC1376075.1 DUF916 and DUF3324 domain-containing protein [Listeria farberi]MBC1380308.1 DUF916 and DUF3324 domain-containing protein [Listeria farberi]MBC2288415.1 DUF916 and DUF3324 domain-containing protein [Listeria farberi]